MNRLLSHKKIKLTKTVKYKFSKALLGKQEKNKNKIDWKKFFSKNDNFVFSNAQDISILMNSLHLVSWAGKKDWKQIWNEINLKMLCLL